MRTHRSGIEEVPAQFGVAVGQHGNIRSQTFMQRGVAIDRHFFEAESELMPQAIDARAHLFAQVAAGQTVECQKTRPA